MNRTGFGLEPKKGGLNIFENDSFLIYRENQGLSDNLIRSIVQDQDGNMWFSTENGINCLRGFGTKDEKIHTYGTQDGLTGLKFFNNCATIDHQNRIWWGSGKNLTMLDLNRFEENTAVPIPQLLRLEINENQHDFHRQLNADRLGFSFDKAKPFFNYPENLVLDHDQNHLTFFYSGIEWTAPHKVKYSYMIEGLDKTWKTPTKETKAEYRNIPYGTYTFKFKAHGDSQVWSEPFNYEFQILAPWWHTWTARFFYVVISLFLIISFVRYRTSKLKKRQIELEDEVSIATEEILHQKNEIEHQHQEIIDSIAYAKRIQTAILPPDNFIKQHLPQSFILYKPKDIVAGDFYWLQKITSPNSSDELILFAAADCTGHGVPGAMVSVICNNGLNRSVREDKLTDPGKILNRTREIVSEEFGKSEEAVNDGMDIALCSLNKNKLNYSGANNPLWIIRKGAVEIEEYKANKQPIGNYINSKPFDTHEIELFEGDTIYIFSDGFSDQFGGDKGKKFKASNFKKLLLSIQGKSPEEQKIVINDTFENWKGSLEQLDDVCVIGYVHQ